LQFIISTQLGAETFAATIISSPSQVPQYDLFQRPDPEGHPTKVLVDVFVYDLADISDVDTTFTVDFFLRLVWRDHRLGIGSQNTKRGYRRLQLNHIWHPRTLIANQRELSKRFEDIVEVDSAGNVTYVQRYQGTLSFEHELKDFPFDNHILPVEVISRYGPEEVVFKEAKTGRGVTLSIIDWEVGSGSAREGTVYIAHFNRTLSSFYYELPVKRHKQFYIWKVIIPLSMIVFMSWAVFFIDPSQVGPRIGLSTAAVLTLIIFQFHLGKLIPQVSYFTRADYFSVGSMILVFLALAETTLVNALNRWEQKAFALKFERWARLTFPIFFVVLFIFAFVV
jgi:hypothetical protein